MKSDLAAALSRCPSGLGPGKAPADDGDVQKVFLGLIG
jgi:hypothetical protein